MKKKEEAHVERLSKTTTRVMVEKRTSSRSRVHEIYAEGRLWWGLLVHERLERSLEAQ